ncbi:MAG TPA: hypothetical protein EYP91_22495 [Gammaproteobacteria bacterium]|nr:hypothetical protein [Gammaproteobacteria bacterium]
MANAAAEDLSRLDRERDLAFSLPLEDIDPTDRRLYQDNVHFLIWRGCAQRRRFIFTNTATPDLSGQSHDMLTSEKLT